MRFGQDYRAAELLEHEDVYPADRTADGYVMPCEPSKASIVISFNCHHPADAKLISALPEDVPVVVHCQLQPTFLDQTQFARAGSALRRAACAIVPAEFMRTRVSEAFSIEDVRVVRNGVDPRRFRPVSEHRRLTYRRREGIPDDARLVVYVGQLAHAKGFEALLQLARNLPDDVVLLVRSAPNRGGPSGLSAFEKKRRDLEGADRLRVKVQKEDGNRDTHPIPYADCVLVTSLSEVAPLVATEALMSGVPVLSTDCTPWYEELALAGIGPSDLRVVPLPSRGSGQRREDLRLTHEEARQVAGLIADVLCASHPPSPSERNQRAAVALEAGMSQSLMLRAFRHLYEHFERTV